MIKFRLNLAATHFQKSLCSERRNFIDRMFESKLRGTCYTQMITVDIYIYIYIHTHRVCIYIYIYIYIYLWCYGYHCRKWSRQPEFKSTMRLFAFHITLQSLGKVWIQLFTLQLWVNNRADLFLNLGMATSLGEKNSEFKLVKLCLKIDLVLHPAHV